MRVKSIKEAYVGEYASGKSEVAVNRALQLLGAGDRPVTLVDFDLVEPFYTLRPLKKRLEAKGIKVIAWDTRKMTGLGETGNLLQPEARWSLSREGHVILDVGYGAAGLEKLRLLEGTKGLRIYAVINVARPMTWDVEAIVQYVRMLGPLVQGLINNSHWGDETEISIINKGAELVARAAKVLGLPVIWTTVDHRFRQQMGKRDKCGPPVFYLERFMQDAVW